MNADDSNGREEAQKNEEKAKKQPTHPTPRMADEERGQRKGERGQNGETSVLFGSMLE